MNKLAGIMEEEAGPGGALSFARFMELALYCPNFGYYEQAGVSPGRLGDYYTSVSTGSLFGELLAFQFAEWLAEAPTQRQHLVEAGAHDGRLALDILNWVRLHCPRTWESLEYWIVEPSGIRKESQRRTLGALARRVRWFAAWEEVPQSGVEGVIFSNELLDAMPVHRIGWDAGAKQWFEWGVKVQAGAFVWTRLALAPGILERGGLSGLPRELVEVLPDGFTTEVSLAAVDWWRGAARALRSGKLLAVDYGLTADQFLVPERMEGTLRAYYRHQANRDLLARPGEQDITGHVNFTLVQQAGEAEGLRTEAFQSQAQFLTGIVRTVHEGKASFGEWSPKQTRQFQTLVHPEHLGRPFRVLLQSR
jgi:SAM-dependent MidA family methyltransferase